jgi:hypothetical protein
MNDSIRDMFRNVLFLTLWPWMSGEMLMTHIILSETTCNDPINKKLPVRLSSMLEPEMSNVYEKTQTVQTHSKPILRVLFYG